MKIYKISKEDEYSFTKIKKWFDERTNKHIKLVQKYCKKLSKKEDKYKELLKRAEKHDQSKFKNPELDPYVYTTWKYKCKDDGIDFEKCNPPKDIDDKMFEATLHHIQNNRHHPEYHADKVYLNKEDRDKPPKKSVDATKMKDLDIAEMVCDWCAVSEEKGGSPKTWAKNNINTRWKFSKKQEELIYELIAFVWN